MAQQTSQAKKVSRSQETSTCDENISDTLDYCLVCHIFYLIQFDVICNLVLNRHTATWNSIYFKSEFISTSTNVTERSVHEKSIFLSLGEHRIVDSAFRNNIHQAISYTSVTDESIVRPSLAIERNKIIDTSTFASNVSQKSAISINIQDNSFTLANNFISGNLLGGIEARLGRSDGISFERSLIYGNTFIGNANGTILVQKRTDGKTNFSAVYVMDNIFESNLGSGSTIKLSEVQSEIFNNFFYNNTGIHTIQYNFSSRFPRGQKCESNTFYLNKGLDQNNGATIVSNGPMEYHSNNFKNPSNPYEFSSTRQIQTIYRYRYGLDRQSDPIDATLNWWGVEESTSVASRIYAEKDDWFWAVVEYIPFHKFPQGNFFSSKY